MKKCWKKKNWKFICHTGERSKGYIETATKAGYNAFNVEGGYRAYLRLSLSRFLEEDTKESKEEKTKEIERSIIKKFRKSIWRPFTKALNEYQLIQEGDKVAVCISGGKDSMLMAKLFQELKLHNKFSFDVKFLVMDPGYSPENRKVIEENARKMKIPIQIF